MKRLSGIFNIISLIIITLVSVGFLAFKAYPLLLIIAVPAFVLCNIFIGIFGFKGSSKRLKALFHGEMLLTIFAVSTTVAVVYHIVLMFFTLPGNWKDLVFSILVAVAALAIVFWNGIISVYLTSVQLGIKHRVVGIICGPLPILNLIALRKIIKTVRAEVDFELEKENIDKARKEQRLCATKYPVLLVHGVFFRDFKYINYWGRIPAALKNNGCEIYYGGHQSASSVADSASELTAKIKEIVNKLGCEKFNIIAHSKG